MHHSAHFDVGAHKEHLWMQSLLGYSSQKRELKPNIVPR